MPEAEAGDVSSAACLATARSYSILLSWLLAFVTCVLASSSASFSCSCSSSLCFSALSFCTSCFANSASLAATSALSSALCALRDSISFSLWSSSSSSLSSSSPWLRSSLPKLPTENSSSSPSSSSSSSSSSSQVDALICTSRVSYSATRRSIRSRTSWKARSATTRHLDTSLTSSIADRYVISASVIMDMSSNGSSEPLALSPCCSSSAFITSSASI
mmetsp:Transcript_17357/g.50474  ORF Transcript_17357/g.50474 Transcript_17357/m.50474 type:complete len:218 (-) Transcript_17357:1254-1907(-)